MIKKLYEKNNKKSDLEQYFIVKILTFTIAEEIANLGFLILRATVNKDVVKEVLIYSLDHYFRN